VWNIFSIGQRAFGRIVRYVESCVFSGDTVSQAYFALHETLHKLPQSTKIFREIFFVGTKFASEAFLSISQNLKVTRLQGGKQTKFGTC
jgi:hypothetical protein